MILNKLLDNYYDIKTGKRYVKAAILADSKPEQLPKTGENIKGLSKDDILAPGSSIFTVNADVAFLGENGWGGWL